MRHPQVSTRLVISALGTPSVVDELPIGIQRKARERGGGGRGGGGKSRVVPCMWKQAEFMGWDERVWNGMGLDGKQNGRHRTNTRRGRMLASRQRAASGPNPLVRFARMQVANEATKRPPLSLSRVQPGAPFLLLLESRACPKAAGFEPRNNSKPCFLHIVIVAPWKNKTRQDKTLPPCEFHDTNREKYSPPNSVRLVRGELLRARCIQQGDVAYAGTGRCKGGCRIEIVLTQLKTINK